MRLTGDRTGNLFVADAHHARIRKIDTATNTITTIAGCGVEGYSGDDGPAVNAQIASPHGTALDRHGNIYIADLKNDRVRRVDASTGIITTVAGNGEHGYSGDGGPATEAMLASPIAVTAGPDRDLYIADHRNSRIRRVDAATGIITTVAGTGEQGFRGDCGPATHAAISLPRDVALDADGTLYIADGANNRIRKGRLRRCTITTSSRNRQDGVLTATAAPRTRHASPCPTASPSTAVGNLLHRRYRQLPRPQDQRNNRHHHYGCRQRLIRLLR